MFLFFVKHLLGCISNTHYRNEIQVFFPGPFSPNIFFLNCSNRTVRTTRGKKETRLQKRRTISHTEQASTGSL